MTAAQNYGKRRILFYWLSRATSYGLPLTYYAVKLGVTRVTEPATTIVMPILILAFLGVVRIGMDVPAWIANWQPSFMKGMLKALPVLLLFGMLITIGLTLQYVIETQPILPFGTYFEAVLTLFGSMSVGSVLEAFHLKNKELDMLNKGFVLGVVRK
jgi:hypothetical protein